MPTAGFVTEVGASFKQGLHIYFDSHIFLSFAVGLFRKTPTVDSLKLLIDLRYHTLQKNARYGIKIAKRRVIPFFGTFREENKKPCRDVVSKEDVTIEFVFGEQLDDVTLGLDDILYLRNLAKSVKKLDFFKYVCYN